LEENEFINNTKELVKKLLLADKINDESIKCYGFKEIRYLDEIDSFFDYLEFLKKIFPNVAFIFNTRNLDDVVKSSWFAQEEPEQLKKEIRRLEVMFSQYCEKYDNGFQITYEDVVSKSQKLKDMFEFLGVKYKPEKIDAILSLPHSYKPRQEHVKKLFEKQYNANKIEELKKIRRLESNRYTLKSFDTYKCIFVHIPKAAGVSVVQSLFGNLGSGHTKIKEYQQLYTETEFKNYFKFTFVRNPWDRLVSAYNFLIEGGMTKEDKTWAKSNLRHYPDFNSFVKQWVNRENIYSCRHFIPQCEFVCIEGLEPAVDFIGYFENLEEDFEYVANKLGIQTTLQHLNQTQNRNNKKDYTEYYTDETAKIVADVYREDIEIFGYDFG